MDNKKDNPELDGFYQIRINKKVRNLLVNHYGKGLSKEVRRFLDLLIKQVK
jgi:hypothetical protein